MVQNFGRNPPQPAKQLDGTTQIASFKAGFDNINVYVNHYPLLDEYMVRLNSTQSRLFETSKQALDFAEAYAAKKEEAFKACLNKFYWFLAGCTFTTTFVACYMGQNALASAFGLSAALSAWAADSQVG